MTGDAQHVYTIKDSDTDPKQQQNEGSFEHFNEKDPGKLNSSNNSISESCKTMLNNSSLNNSHLHRKNKASYNQREAVIRPQQAGRIDFKSFQNRPKFSSERTWSSSSNSSGKSPQSPSGKSKGRDKNKRYGKGPHHLYKLSIVNSRSNPTIGIAYPQQKVTSTKKLEGNRELITGSYRFNVPSIPEREAELQQEDLSYNRRFQEDSANHTSTSYTSHTTVVTCQHQALKAQSQVNINVPRDNSNSNGQLQYPEFHGNRNNTNISPFSVDWHSPDKTFTGTNYGMPSHKQSTFPAATESNKPNSQGFRSIPFQYPLPQLHEAAADPFNSEHSSQCHFQQDYLDVSLPNNHLAHSSFVFQLSTDGQEETLSNGRYGTSSDGRSYTQPSHQTQFVRPSNQGTQHQSPLSCYKGRADHTNDTNGAISSAGALSSSTGAISSAGAIEQNQSTYQENQTVCSSDTFNLHNNGVGFVSMNKKCSSLKDNRGTERMLTRGKPPRRNITHSSLPQMHFQDKVYGGSSNSSVPDGVGPFDKNISNKTHSHPRVPQVWEGSNKMFPTKDQNSAPYSASVANQFSYPCQSVTNLSHADHRQHVPRNGASRLPWQQIHLTSAMPNQNRIELSRQLSSQQLAFPLGTSEWQECKKIQKNAPICNPAVFRNKNHVHNEELQNARNDGSRQNCNTATAFPFQNGLDNANPSLCDSRNENTFCGLNQPVVRASSRGGGHTTLSMPKVSLMSASPYQSPPPSPALNPGSTSTCSSLSPVSTVYSANSPLNTNSEESQVPIVVTPPNFYHQHCHTKEGKNFSSSEQINADLLHHHYDPIRTFTFSSADRSRGTKDNHLLYIQENAFSQQNAQSNGCTNSFDSDSQPFSEQQLFAHSLSSANLDQLDVLLTCKQCDQNFSNVASFLDHRQYCGLHSACHTQLHEAPRMVESRRFQAESAKAAVFHSTRGGADLHPPLLCLNKPCDLLLDSEAAGDPKDDPFKLNIFSGTGSSSISLTASDLEIDDAKLDSLINETLNGLDYQSDNAEIDSSFIEAFADDELSTTKSAGNGLTFKTKDCIPLENKIITKLAETEDKQAVQIKIIHNNGKDDRNIQRQERNRHPYRKSEEKDAATALSSRSYSKRVDKYSIKNFSPETSFDPLKYSKPSAKIGKLRGGRKLSTDATLQRRISEVLPQPARSVRKNSERDKHKGNSDMRSTVHPTPLEVVTESSSSRLRRPAVKDIKKRKSDCRTWSKELIHKIVQQKNKLHKLHVKGNKNLQLSLVTERLLPTQHNSKLGEYDYISDSDQETEALSSKYLTPCLNQLAKYSITKEHKTKGGRVKAEESWRYIKIRKTPERSIETESHNQTKGYYDSRFRRRSSRSSTSSDYSNITSSSSENTNSPNSIERTDSDNERGKNTAESKHSTPISITDHTMHSALNVTGTCTGKPAGTAKDGPIDHSTLSRSTKKFGSAKFLLSGRRSHRTSHNMMHLGYYDESNITQAREMEEHCTAGSNTSHMELGYGENRPQTSKSSETNIEMTSAATTAPNTELTFDQRVMEKFSSCEDSIVEYPTASVSQNSSTHISELATDMKDELTDISKKMKGSLVGSTVVYEPNAGCFRDNSSGFNIQAHDDTAQNGMNRIYCGHKDLENQHHSDIFSQSLPGGSSHLEDIFFCQNESSDNYLQKNHVKRFINAYPREKYQDKIKSPVSFNAAGIFGDITISSFDSQLYTDTSVNKENYFTFSCSAEHEDNRTAYHLQYPPFLEHKDWNLLQDVTTVLPEEISHFEDLSIQPAQNKKFAHTAATSPIETPPLLPEKINDQNSSFTASLSDDDLEIKRLVTELENQLQTPRRNDETTVAQVSTEQYMNVNLKDQISPLTSLHLEQDNGSKKNIYIPNNHFSSEGSCTDQVSNPPKVADQSTVGNIEDNEDIWACSFQLVSLDAEPDFQTPDKVRENQGSPRKAISKDNQPHYQIGPKESEKIKENEHKHSNQEVRSVSPGSYSEKSEEKLENQHYTENLIASLAIMSDTVLGKNSLEQGPDVEEGSHPLSKNENSSSCSSTDHDKSFNLSSQYGSSECDVAEKQPEHERDTVLFTFGKSAPSPGVQATVCSTENDFSFVNADDSQEELFVNHNQQSTTSNQSCSKTEISALLSESEEAEPSLIVTSQNNSSKSSPLTKYKERTNDNVNPSFVVTRSAEQHSSTKKTIPVSPESTANPLQQLQLFVARTVRCNEELMMMPCYPVPHALTNQSSNGNSSSEQNEEVFNSTHNPEIASNAKDKTMYLQGISKNECQILDAEAGTKSRDCLPQVPCVAENIAETVTEKVKTNSSSWEYENTCNRSTNSEVHSMVTSQLLTSQIHGSLLLKKTPESKDDVIVIPDLTEDQRGLLSLNATNENLATVQGKPFNENTENLQNSKHSSTSLVFKQQENTEKVTPAVLNNDIVGQSAEKGKQCLDVLEKNLQPDESNCPLPQSNAGENNCDEKKMVKHLTTDDIPQCKPTLGITDPMKKLKFQFCTDELLPSIDGSSASPSSSDLSGVCNLTQLSEIDTVCSRRESISEQLPLSMPGSYSNVAMQNDKCEQQKLSNSSQDNFLPKDDRCNESLTFLHLPYNSQNTKKKSLSCVTEPQENVINHDFEYKLAEKQVHDGHSASEAVPIGENISDDIILLSKRSEELPTTVTTNDYAAKDSDKNTADNDNRSFSGKDTTGDNRSFEQTASMLTDLSIYMQTKSNDCTISEMLAKSPTSHLSCSVNLESNNLCTPSNDSSALVESEGHSKCAYTEILCPHYNESVLPPFHGQLLELPSPPQNVPDLSVHCLPLVSISMETLNKYSDNDNSDNSAQRISDSDSNAQIDCHTENAPLKPEESLHNCVQGELFPNGIKQLEGNLFTDNESMLNNSESLTEDDKLCCINGQKHEALGITDNAKQLKECSDGKTANQLMEISEEFRDEVVKESDACGDTGLFHLSEERSQPVMNRLGRDENSEKDGMSRDDVLSSLVLSRTLSDLHSSECLDLVPNNLFSENALRTASQKLVEFSTSAIDHNLQTVIMCNVCSASFRSKQGLMRHKAIKHHLKDDNTLSQNKVNRIQANCIQTEEANLVWKQDIKNVFCRTSEKKTHTEDKGASCSSDNSVNKETIQSDQQLFLKRDKHIKGNNSTFTSNEIVLHCKKNQHLSKAAVNTDEIHYGSTKEETKPCVIQSGQDTGIMACKEKFEAKQLAKVNTSKSKKNIGYSRGESTKQIPYSIGTKHNERHGKKQNSSMPNPTKDKSRNVGKNEPELCFNGIIGPDFEQSVTQSGQQMNVSCGEKENETCPLLQLQVMAESCDSTVSQEQTEDALSTSKTNKMCVTSKEWAPQEKFSNNGTISVEEKDCNLISVLLKEKQYKKEWNGGFEPQIDVAGECSLNKNIQKDNHVKIEQETSEKEVNLLQKNTECQHSDQVIPSVFNSSMPNQINGSPLKITDVGPQAMDHDEVTGRSNNENSFEKMQDITASKPWDEPYSIDLELPALEVIHPNSESHLSNMNNTISQIFPEENTNVRKKCPRVYGKRSKKRKVDTESNTFGRFSADFMIEDSEQALMSCRDDLHHIKRPEHYETISIDDTIMLHISHNSKTVASKRISVCDELKRLRDDTHKCRSQDVLESTEMSENDSSNVMGLLYQNCKIETLSDAVLNSTVWSNPQEVVGISTHGDISSFEMSSEKVPDAQNRISIIQSQQELSETLSSQLLEPYDSLASDQCNLANLDVSDIQVLNQGYELPDRHPLNSPGNKSSIPNVTSSMSEETSGNIKLSKVKSEEGKMAKNRSDISIKSKDKQYKCKVCFQWFLTLGELDFHKLSHNPSPPPTCYMCVQRKFSSREQLRDHLKEKHAKNKAGIWTCGMCLKEISDVWMYNEHLREHATQFARKGQAQKSVIGLSSCFSEDSAMKNFFNTILNKKQGKSTKTVDSVTRSLIKESKVLKENQEQTWNIKEQSVKNKLNFTSALKLSTSSNPELMQKTEPIQKDISIHPDCKDPSRDCHHCGKQFPKPFKLQRHLVVHSLQKIYLCYMCPIFYLEMQELRTHLKGEHRVIEEPEVKHTTLYTCELCADVMHVIKKSFICSTCNYTFSKKEQYDRHMEKHLAGGSKTQKFRGVMRPHVPLQDGNLDPQGSLSQPYSSISLPPNKKQKTNHNGLIEVNTENNIPTVPSIHFEHNVCEGSLHGPPDFLSDVVNDATVKLNDLTPKCPDTVGDFSELLVELEQSQPNIATPPPSLSPAICHPLSNDLHLVDLAVLPMPDVHSQLYNMTSSVSSVNTCAFKPNGNVVQSNHSAKEKIKQAESCNSFKQTNDLQKIPYSSHVKIAAIDKTKQNASEHKPLEKQVIDLEAKLSQKKRKEHKPSSVKYSSSYRITVDEGSKKRKQMRTDYMRKSDIPQDNQGITTSRGETTGSHLTARAKPWTNSSPSKKNGMNFCPPKQPEMRSFNGEFRHKKELISKPLLYSKGGAQSVNSSIRKHRLMQGLKPMESQNYRTAESQSNLLSQLFGQKITSFKIPLRKDTSE
ncbi:zinc finger protein 469 [Heptranchias perlo]|uniref:zinc finger protein 469 n=1 Tax=Heptranchias perlo TaxID=212740 RepID=UPI00355941A0